MLIAVKVLHVFLVVIVAGLNDKFGHPLEVAVSFRLSDVGILVVIGDHQLPRRTVQVGAIGAIGPLKNRAASAGIGRHVVVGGSCGVVHIIGFGDFHRLVQIVDIIQHQPYQNQGCHGIIPLRQSLPESCFSSLELAGLEPASRGFPGPHSTLELQFHLNTLVMPTGVEPIFPA